MSATAPRRVGKSVFERAADAFQWPTGDARIGQGESAYTCDLDGISNLVWAVEIDSQPFYVVRQTVLVVDGGFVNVLRVYVDVCVSFELITPVLNSVAI